MTAILTSECRRCASLVWLMSQKSILKPKRLIEIEFQPVGFPLLQFSNPELANCCALTVNDSIAVARRIEIFFISLFVFVCFTFIISIRRFSVAKRHFSQTKRRSILLKRRFATLQTPFYKGRTFFGLIDRSFQKNESKRRFSVFGSLKDLTSST